MLSKKVHRYIYIFSLILLGVSIPFSVFLMSVSQFLLATNWLLELDFKNKWTRIKQNKPALYLIGLFALHLIWLLNSSNMEYAWHDIRIKVPLFVLAVLVGSTERLQYSEFKIILHFFILAIVSSSVVSLLIYYGIIEREINDVRQISIFISHIRLSLLVNIGLFSTYYWAIKTKNKRFKAIYFFTSIYLVVFLFILNSYTGVFIFIITLLFLLLRTIIRKGKVWLKISALSSIIVLMILGLYLSVNFYQRFYNIDEQAQIEALDHYTANGNPYLHDVDLKQIENGHFVYTYISHKELEKAWDTRSTIPYKTGLNAKGGPVRMTLLYYLTSLNLRKDSTGMAQLANEDIKAIEQGYSNYIYKNRYSLYTKAYPILEQLYYYREMNYAEGGSLTQRFEYLRIAKKIIGNHFWLGTGTGDVDDAFKTYYLNKESALSKQFQHRAHNQFITFFISFGVFGFLLAVFFMFAGFYKQRFYFLPMVFFWVAFLSMLDEDTLESQAGITFFTYFYMLFLIAFSFDYYNTTKQLQSSDTSLE